MGISKTNTISRKSDLEAKSAFASILRKRGYDPVEITSKPADLTAYRGKRKFYFELKFTSQVERYFGAATLTEWREAARAPSSYRFVVAMRKGRKWCFEEYTPKEFMSFSYIPPFKIFFNLQVTTRDTAARVRSRAIALTTGRLRQLLAVYDTLGEH